MLRPRCALLGILALAAASCDEDVTATVVTVEARDAVRPVATLEVTLANANATLTETLDLRGASFPATFSVSTPNRAGELTVTVLGRDVAGDETAHGRATTTIERGEVGAARVVLEPSDFLVNTVIAGDQQLIFVSGNSGRQIAARPNGDFTVGFSDDCGELDRCDVWGRTFDRNSKPLATAIASGDAQFNLNRGSDTFGTDPAVAVGPAGHRVAIWWALDRVFCTGFDPDGKALTPNEVVLSIGPIPQQPSVVAMAPGRYAVTWEENDVAGASQIFGALIDDACKVQRNAITLNEEPFAIFAAPADVELELPVVAVSGSRLGFVWRNERKLQGRFTNDDGAFGGREIDVVPSTVAALGGQHLVGTSDGYLVAYTGKAGIAPGELFARRLNRGGAAAGPVSRIATELNDTVTAASAALARRADGAVVISWHSCGFSADPDCSVLARVVRETALPVGDAFHVNTTITGRQSDPSIAALGDSFAVVWTDTSRASPDTSGAGVRARVIYPTFDDATAILGARCGGDAAVCNEGLTCLAGSDQVPRCHASCVATGPAPQCPDGGACTTSGDVSGCIF